MRRTWVVSLGMVLALAGGGCGIGDAVGRATAAVDRAMADINNNSSQWQAILQRLASELPNEISSSIRNDAQNLVTRSIAAAGIEARCGVDFLAERVVAGLQRIRNWLTSGEEPPEVEPSLCHVAPAMIDLKASPDSWSSLSLTGYDLDHRDGGGNLLGARILGIDGTAVEVPESRIGHTTHYEVTINLRGMERDLYYAGAGKVQAMWNGAPMRGQAEAVIGPWSPKEVTDSSTLNTSSCMPPRTYGDGDFDTDDDNPMTIDARASIRVVNGRQVQGTLYMYAQEEDSDYTTVQGTCAARVLYTIPAAYQFSYRIWSITPNAPAQLVTKITAHDRQDYGGQAGEVIYRWSVWGDRDGDEAGSWTRVEATWATFSVVLREMKPSWLP